MKCYVIKDLLPEYEEGLCSEETRKEIEEHLADCEACRKLYGDLMENGERTEDVDTKTNQTFYKNSASDEAADHEKRNDRCGAVCDLCDIRYIDVFSVSS